MHDSYTYLSEASKNSKWIWKIKYNYWLFWKCIVKSVYLTFAIMSNYNIWKVISLTYRNMSAYTFNFHFQTYLNYHSTDGRNIKHSRSMTNYYKSFLAFRMLVRIIFLMKLVEWFIELRLNFSEDFYIQRELTLGTTVQPSSENETTKGESQIPLIIEINVGISVLVTPQHGTKTLKHILSHYIISIKAFIKISNGYML